MKQLKIRIKLLSPVIMSLASGDSTMTQTLSYIPGSTLLGLLANLYIPQHEMDDFNRLFMMGELRFLNLYPFVNGIEYIPSPQNLWKEKKPDSKMLYNNSDMLYNMFDPEANAIQRKKNGGFVSRRVFTSGTTQLFEPPKQLSFHHERNYSKGVSEKGVVFNYEALSAGNEFYGYILGKEADLLLMQELLTKPKHLRLGKSKTAQYGKCELVESKIEDLPAIEATGSYMLLCSDAIIYNESGSSCVDKELLAKRLGVKIEAAFMDSGRYETAVNILKAKRPSEYTIKAGSIFKLDRLPENYRDLQLYGIGERRWEGFGELIFTSVKNCIISDAAPQSFPKPEGDVPLLIKDICTTTLRRLEKSQLKKEAYDTAENVEVARLSKSLIARLEAFALSGDFYKSFNQLKKTAKDKLGKSYVNDHTNLSDLLEQENLKNVISEIQEKTSWLCLGQGKSLTDLKTEFDLEGLDNKEASSIFLRTFLLSLRRIINQKQKGGKQ